MEMVPKLELIPKYMPVLVSNEPSRTQMLTSLRLVVPPVGVNTTLLVTRPMGVGRAVGKYTMVPAGR